MILLLICFAVVGFMLSFYCFKLAISYKRHPGMKEATLKQLKEDKVRRQIETEKSLEQIKIDHEQRRKQIEIDREQRRLARIPSRQTLRVTIVSKTPNYLQSGYYEEVLLFEDTQHQRYSFTRRRKESDLLAVGDTGVLIFDQYTTGKQTFVSFTLDPATPNPNPST